MSIMTVKTLSSEEYQSLSWSEQRKYVKEWACTCNECNKKWHYLSAVEDRIKSEQFNNAMMGLGMSCNPCMTTATSNANTQLEQQEAKLKSCPKCGSSNVTKTAKYFKRQH